MLFFQNFLPARPHGSGAGGKGERVAVRARIETITGYSSHKDSDGIVEMVSNTAPTVKKVFVVMGEPKASAFLTQRLREELDVDAIYPTKGQVYKLDI